MGFCHLSPPCLGEPPSEINNIFYRATRGDRVLSLQQTTPAIIYYIYNGNEILHPDSFGYVRVLRTCKLIIILIWPLLTGVEWALQRLLSCVALHIASPPK
jgi:hypothetical protein